MRYLISSLCRLGHIACLATNSGIAAQAAWCSNDWQGRDSADVGDTTPRTVIWELLSIIFSRHLQSIYIYMQYPHHAAKLGSAYALRDIRIGSPVTLGVDSKQRSF